MNTKIWMEKFLAILGSAVMGTMFTTVADATVEPVTAEVTFAGAISIVEANALQFGVLDDAFAIGESITIGTGGGATGDIGRIIGGTQAAAELTITATALVQLSIVVGNIFSGPGYTLDTFICNYDGDGDTACESAYFPTPTAAASAALFIGATVTGDGSATAGNADGSFDVTVIYQ